MAGRRRLGGSDGASPNLCDGSPAGRVANRSAILGFMYGYYKEALDALPLERMPALGPRLLQSGVCFGFGDPVTNIIANTLSFLPDEGGEPAPEPEVDGTRMRKRKKICPRGAGPREEVFSKIVAGDSPSPPAARTIAERSLEGLVTFLTSYYRYLPTWDALRYLYRSQADLLVAVRLIELDRCHRRKDGFRIGSHAVEIALKCATLSSCLPNVDAFLTFSAVLVSHLTHTVPGENCPRRRRLSMQDVSRLSGLLEMPLKPIKSKNLMDRAAMQPHQRGTRPALMESLRGLLLDRIHIIYMKAISRIPMQDFRRRHHHGLLKAGYCYGPFNPIFNIIINTVWYDATFPAPQEFEVDMMCTKIFIRLESLSLDGLINLLLACISGISEHEAMVYLLKSNLELPRAIWLAGQDGYGTTSGDVTAYKAAADASSHPEPEAYVQFAMESLPMARYAVTELLNTRTLSSSKIIDLAKLLSTSKSYPYPCLEPTDELTKDALEMVSSCKETFFDQQNFIRKKVEATLRNYEQNKEQYEFRFICTLNENVGGKSFKDSNYPYSHVNFWASPKDETSLTLFFAQISNDDEDKEYQWSFCRPVLQGLSTNSRCCYCDLQGTRIAHPIEHYCGGSMDFERMALGMHTMDNTEIISHGKLRACGGGIFREDYIYFDPSKDVKFIRAMNKSAWAENINWGDEIKRIKGMKHKSKNRYG